jgi:hypothetical protein
MKTTEGGFVKYQDLIELGTAPNLIPVHINKMRDETHFWDWNSNIGDWVQGEEIPELLNKAYKTPITKSTYY